MFILQDGLQEFTWSNMYKIDVKVDVNRKRLNKFTIRPSKIYFRLTQN